MKKNYFFILLLLSSFMLVAQSNITFSVDMAGQTFTQAYVSGSFNGWSGTDNPLTNTSGTIWEATLPIADGEYEYKFTFDDWVGQDTFTQGDVCTITNYGNTNRRLVVAGADQTLDTVSFDVCAESATNPGPHTVTFNVDMSSYGGTLGTVYINGENYNSQGLGAWCGSCTPMTDQGGGIWSITLSLEEYAYQYKFTVDGWTDQESFTIGDPETATDGTFTNRYVSVDADKTIDAVWNAPQTLDNSSFEAVEFTTYPNPTKSNWNLKANTKINTIQLFDVLGKQVLSIKPNTTNVTIDTNSLNVGLYFAKLTTSLGTKTIKLVKE